MPTQKSIKRVVDKLRERLEMELSEGETDKAVDSLILAIPFKRGKAPDREELVEHLERDGGFDEPGDIKRALKEGKPGVFVKASDIAEGYYLGEGDLILIYGDGDSFSHLGHIQYWRPEELQFSKAVAVDGNIEGFKLSDVANQIVETNTGGDEGSSPWMPAPRTSYWNPCGSKHNPGSRRARPPRKRGITKTAGGRAGIGAGAGWLVLGPIGAIAGSVYGASTAKSSRGNPTRRVYTFKDGTQMLGGLDYGTDEYRQWFYDGVKDGEEQYAEEEGREIADLGISARTNKLFDGFEKQVKRGIAQWIKDQKISEDEKIELAEKLSEHEGMYADVFHTLDGSGVGLWDGRMDHILTEAQVESLTKALKKSAGKYVMGGGSGLIEQSLSMDISGDHVDGSDSMRMVDNRWRERANPKTKLKKSKGATKKRKGAAKKKKSAAKRKKGAVKRKRK